MRTDPRQTAWATVLAMCQADSGWFHYLGHRRCTFHSWRLHSCLSRADPRRSAAKVKAVAGGPTVATGLAVAERVTAQLGLRRKMSCATI